ncbi:DUF2721 domain-containing protein [Gemmata sp. JC717]|uniref:DUF2721 domain-containing protein n=1 Tax=Gemmata algarum TaxID=2975278 RepID=UPI0021BB9086|nr:DUF2721 domain-containing protein [Gemmata algarum]MDY3555522.1 DUF2721 domain-containing protein [Gemmata algarum]
MTAIDFLGAGEILGAMITPALLISASGTLSLSTANRLGRVVDRIRALTEVAEGLPDGVVSDDVVAKRALIADQIRWHTQRLTLLQSTIVTLYTAIGLLVGASLTVGLSASTKWALGWIPVAFGLSGACALLVAAVRLIRESRLAVRGAQVELSYVAKVVARKTTVPVPIMDKPEGGQGEG